MRFDKLSRKTRLDNPYCFDTGLPDMPIKEIREILAYYLYWHELNLNRARRDDHYDIDNIFSSDLASYDVRIRGNDDNYSIQIYTIQRGYDHEDCRRMIFHVQGNERRLKEMLTEKIFSMLKDITVNIENKKKESVRWKYVDYCKEIREEECDCDCENKEE